MPSSKKSSSKAATTPASSADLQGILKRVKASALSADDKGALKEILNQSIKLRRLVEKSKLIHGDRTVIARLPNGMDIVK